MTWINCHSSYKHYEMFHNSCSGESNYGSVFNTTYNINCGGHGGGFWGGFGAGLGNAFGSIFGGMIGGGMSNFGFGNFSLGNFGMGGFGMGGFGMGGLTMPWFNSMGNFGWGGGNVGGASGTNSNNSSNSSNGVNDKDNALIEAFEKKVNKLGAKNLDDAKALYKQIKEKYENPEDDTYKNQNKLAYGKLLDNIKAKYPNVTDWDADAGKDKKTDNDGKADKEKPTTGKQEVTDPTAQGVDPAKQAEDAKKAEEAKKAADEAAQKLKDANSMDDLLGVDYDKLSDADKANYMQKMRAYVDAMSPDELKAKLDSLSDAQRNLVLKAIYNGAENVTEANFNELVKKGAKINVIDHSDKDDFINATITDVSGSTITIVTEHKTLKISYNKGASKYGEMIFHGAKGETQKYALQIKNGVLYLNQYKYHDGFNVADIDKNNRKNHINK